MSAYCCSALCYCCVPGRSGALSWEAPWNSHLRHTLLAPHSGACTAFRLFPATHSTYPGQQRFACLACQCAKPLLSCCNAGLGGHGLRLSLASATLGVADLPAGAVPGDGLWQLHQAAAISTAVQLDAVVCAKPASAAATVAASTGSAGGSSGTQVAAAISPLQVHASGQQAAVLAQVAATALAELSAGFSAPLVAEQPSREQAQQQPWLAKLSLNLATGVQVAYTSSGSLQHWHDPRTASARPQPASASSSSSSGTRCAAQGGGSPGFEVRLGSVMLAVALTPGAAAAAAAAPSLQRGGQAGQQHHPHLVLQAQLEEAQLVLQPEFAVQLPVVEVRLGSAVDLAAPAMLAEPLLLVAALSYQRHSSTDEEAEQQQQQQEHGRRRSCSSTVVQCGSLALAVSAADYPLLLGVLCCVRQQAALPSRPALVAGVGLLPGQQLQALQTQEGQQQRAGSSQALEQAVPEEDQASELTVLLDGVCVSVWPQQQHAAQPPASQQQQHGLAVRLCRLRLHKQQSVAARGGASSTMELSLAAANAALVRHPQAAMDSNSEPSRSPQWSPVLTFPAASAQQRGLMLTLRSSSAPGGGVVASPRHGLSPSKGPPGGQRLQLQAAPVSLALTPELFAVTGAISGGISSTAGAEPAGGEEREAGQPESERAALAAAEAAALQGKAALQGLRLVMAEAACWADQWPAGQQLQPPAAALAAPAVAFDIEEAVLLLQRTPAAENRPWLAGGGSKAAGSLLTAVDASLIGAAITVHHTGALGGMVAASFAWNASCQQVLSLATKVSTKQSS